MRSFIVILALLLCPVLACAAPFLVCDAPLPADQVTHYTGLANGVPFNNPIVIHGSGAAIVFDFASVGPEAVTFTEIKACNARGCSSAVTFNAPGLPGLPANLRMVE